ncbi:hypothetical protein CPB83DRAFT_864334 [Crepidotus variabilis]|uniref:Uncharacterized protein n=1 Tax=Crepidotus variabilis TaxID=179855 RepID=A0A9P6E4W3_9AGAR|nr:hypothetical protein CPB83DRAFT_864334 [Crepidotus variabilis]
MHRHFHIHQHDVESADYWNLASSNACGDNYFCLRGRKPEEREDNLNFESENAV